MKIKWTEGTPKKPGEYLVTVYAPGKYYVRMDYWLGKLGWYSYGKGYTQVIAWAPSPEPYKPDEEAPDED